MLEQTGLGRARRRRAGHAVGRQPPAGEHRRRPARRPAGAAARRAVVVAGPAPARAPVGVHRPRSPPAARRSSSPRTTSARPSATPTACSCWPTARCSSAARRRDLEAPSAATRGTSRPRSCASCTSAGTDVRWLLLKDLQILRRSPLLVVLLVAYPVIIALLIGLALSRGPDKPKVAIVNELPAGRDELHRSAASASTPRSTPTSCSSRSTRSAVDTREEAIAKVESGEVARRARSCPPDVDEEAAATRSTSPARRAADGRGHLQRRGPAQAQLVESTIKSRAGRRQPGAQRASSPSSAASYLRHPAQGRRLLDPRARRSTSSASSAPRRIARARRCATLPPDSSRARDARAASSTSRSSRSRTSTSPTRCWRPSASRCAVKRTVLDGPPHAARRVRRRGRR